MYKKWSIKEVEDEINKISTDFKFKFDLPIEISKRAKKRLGAFYFKIENKKIKPIKFVFAEILLNGTYSEKIVKEVIAHEYIHYYCDVKTNRVNKHNRYFKDVCRAYGISDKATLRIEGDLKTEDSKGYKLYCEKCNELVAIYKRRETVSKKIAKYISKCCRTKLYCK